MKNKKIRSMTALYLCCLLICIGCGSDTYKDTGQKTGVENKKPEVSVSASESPEEEKKSPEPVEKSDLVSMIPADSEDPPKAGEKADIDSQLAEYLEKMTIEEKVAQLFIIQPEAAVNADIVTEAGAMTEEAINNIPVGGFIYMEQNLQYPDQVREMLSAVQEYSMARIGLPLFTCIDEEGGSVARINGNPNFNVPAIGNMSEIGASGDPEEAYHVGQEIGEYLSELGFNVDFAPVADVLSNPSNEVVRERSFSSDPDVAAEMAASVLKGMKENNISGAFKHYPGHGATENDSHEGVAQTTKTLDDLLTCELIPFERGIQEGVDFIMAGHISLPNIIGDSTPASLSYKMLSEILRDQMDYRGIIITDAMNMGAITEAYSSGDAAVKAIQAGVDIILMPEDFNAAYQSVLNAVNNQVIPADRIDDSVSRILKVKLSMPKS